MLCHEEPLPQSHQASSIEHPFYEVCKYTLSFASLQIFPQVSCRIALQPFRYKNLGSMATIGRHKAVVELGKFHSQGFFAWVLWLVVHLRSILGVKNKVMVMLNWLWKYVSYNDSIRMITYATKPKEVRDRLKREQTTHLGTDLLENEEEED